MGRPWHTLDRVASDAGRLELRRRGEGDYLIALDGRILMNSRAHASERALGELAADALGRRRAPRVLLGGLGMGFTLRALLDRLPPGGRVRVDELNPAVVAWCGGPIAHLSRGALADPRVDLAIADVADSIARAARTPAGGFDAIVLDLYRGPNADTDARRDPFYGASALARTRAALRPGGAFAVWSEERCPRFERRLRAAGFESEHRRPGRGGRRHAVYLGRVADSGARARRDARA